MEKLSQSEKKVLKIIKDEVKPFCKNRILILLRNKYNSYLEFKVVDKIVDGLCEKGYLKDVGLLPNKYIEIATRHFIIIKK